MWGYDDEGSVTFFCSVEQNWNFTDDCRARTTAVRFKLPNKMTSLPLLLKNLPNLKRLDGFECMLKTINVDAFANPSTITHINLSDSKLEEIPSSIGLCTNLLVLNVINNFIKKLPMELALKCEKLLALYVERNPLEWPFSRIEKWTPNGAVMILLHISKESDEMRKGIMYFMWWWQKQFLVKPVGKMIAQMAWAGRWERSDPVLSTKRARKN